MTQWGMDNNNLGVEQDAYGGVQVLDFSSHGGSLATVARPRREHGEFNVPTYGHDYKHGELYIPSLNRS